MTPSTSSGAAATSAPPEVLGRTEPRIWTPPLRRLTRRTSYGFDVIDFAENTLGVPLDPWEQWLVVHAGEMLPDGRPRFRKVLVLVARQNGKTYLAVVLTLYWLFIECVAYVLGTSTKLDYAAESWRKACKLARRVPRLAAEISHRGAIRRANGEQVLWRANSEELELDEGSRYKIAASNAEGGRSMTVDRLVLDELRQHYDYSAYDASVPATSAVLGAQIFALSNAGSDQSVVLNDMRREAMGFIESGEGDPRLGIFEWSAHEDASPLDVAELAQANPNLGRRLDLDSLLGDARNAMRIGGQKLAGFKTEHMCISVKHLNVAIDPELWKACRDEGDLSAVRDRVALCWDVSMDGQHVALVAAAVLPAGVDPHPPVAPQDDSEAPTERVRVEVVAAWTGTDAVRDFRRDYRGWVRKVAPRTLGWFPSGPGAELATDMTASEDGDWPPEGVEIQAIRKDMPAVCMGFAGQIRARLVAQADDPMLTPHVLGAEKLFRGDGWVFTRRGVGHVNACYAAAGAVYLARTLPPPPKKLPRPMIV